MSEKEFDDAYKGLFLIAKNGSFVRPLTEEDYEWVKRKREIKDEKGTPIKGDDGKVLMEEYDSEELKAQFKDLTKQVTQCGVCVWRVGVESQVVPGMALGWDPRDMINLMDDPHRILVNRGDGIGDWHTIAYS